MLWEWREAEWVGDKLGSTGRQPEASRSWHVVARCAPSTENVIPTYVEGERQVVTIIDECKNVGRTPVCGLGSNLILTHPPERRLLKKTEGVIIFFKNLSLDF